MTCPKTPNPEAVRRERIAVHPIGRLGHPQDLAGLAVYPASDESFWVTEVALWVDGDYLSGSPVPTPVLAPNPFPGIGFGPVFSKPQYFNSGCLCALRLIPL
jgi:hypothetical protein